MKVVAIFDKIVQNSKENIGFLFLPLRENEENRRLPNVFCVGVSNTFTRRYNLKLYIRKTIVAQYRAMRNAGILILGDYYFYFLINYIDYIGPIRLYRII